MKLKIKIKSYGERNEEITDHKNVGLAVALTSPPKLFVTTSKSRKRSWLTPSVTHMEARSSHITPL